MTAAAIFALPLAAQPHVRGGSSHSSGGSYSSGHSRSSQSVSPRSSSGSGHTYSPARPSGSAHAAPSGGGSISGARRPSGSFSGGSHSSGSSSYGSAHPSRSAHARPSGSSLGDVRSNGARVQSGSGSHSSGSHGTGGYASGGHSSGLSGGAHISDGARRPGGIAARRPADGSVSTRSHYGSGSNYGSGSHYGSHNGSHYGARRPAPGHVHAAPAGRAPGRVYVNPHLGSAPAHHRPVHRELRGTPAAFAHYGHHHYGHYVPALPPRYELHRYWGRDYYYYDNIWYRYHSGRYWVCRPPFGYVFTPLADAVYTACRFAYYFDTLNYYNTVSDNARTIQEQNSTIAANNALIAQQNETIAMNSAMAKASGTLANSLGLVQSYADAGTEYFYNDGVFYVKGADGQYKVIVPPAGALVESLPDDYETIELQGQTYYKVDDTVYRMVVSDGKALFEVLGQIVS